MVDIFHVACTATTKNQKQMVVTRNITINLSTVCDLFMVAFVSNDRPWSSHLVPSHLANRWMYTREYMHLGGVFSNVHPQISESLKPGSSFKSPGKYHCNSRGFNYFSFSPGSLGKIPILTGIFQVGWNHQLVMMPERWVASHLQKLLNLRHLCCLLGKVILPCVFYCRYFCVVSLFCRATSNHLPLQYWEITETHSQTLQQ